MMLLLVAILGIGLCARDFYKVPLLCVFILVAAYALCITRVHHSTKGSLPFIERLHIFSRGAGEKNLLQMIWIFVMAGAFAESARRMGAVDAMVNLTLSVMPASMILMGLFLAALLVSLGIGTSVGTIVAITPFAADLATVGGLPVAIAVAAVVGGALFGDNLSFISDTTVAATQTQHINMREKFRANLAIALPAALLTTAVYLVLGLYLPEAQAEVQAVNWLHILPYLYVLIAALMGLHVTIVLFTANLLTGLIGIATGAFGPLGWTDAMTRGIAGMGELILISMLAGGLLSLIRYNGGLTWLIYCLRRRVQGPRGAGLAIAALVSIVDSCTANNTIAILSVGRIARDIADRYGVSRRRSASILDTYSCCTQGILPYGAQLLMAAGIAGISPMQIIPWLFYPFILFVVATGVLLLPSGFSLKKAVKS